MFVETVFKSSFSFSDFFFKAVVALYHVNEVFRVTRSGLSSVEESWGVSASVRVMFSEFLT